MTDERMRDAAQMPIGDAVDSSLGTDERDPSPEDAGSADDGIDTVAYECAASDEDAGTDDGTEWPCAEPNGALEVCVADAFDCAPSRYGSVAVASNGTELALVSVTWEGEAIFARFDNALRPLGMVSFSLETGGYIVGSPRLAAHPGGWIFTYEAGAGGFHVLGLSPNGSRARRVGKLDNGLAIRLAERPGGTPLVLVMASVSIDEARAYAIAIADDLSSFKVTDLGNVSVRDGVFVGDGYLAVMETQGPSSQTSLQRLALDGTPVGSPVHQGTDLYRFGLVSDDGNQFFYTAYSPELQQGYVVEVANDGTQLGEPQPLDPALNPEQGGSVLAWGRQHVMLERSPPQARLMHIDAARQVTALATLTAPTDGIPIGLVRLADRAVAVIVSQASPYDAVTLAAVAP